MQPPARVRDREHYTAEAMAAPDAVRSALRSALREAVRAAVAGRDGRRFVLAVSGGRDSMAMLDAFWRFAPDSIAAVATVDHGTGAHATGAVRTVAEWCAGHDVRAVAAHLEGIAPSEAGWRAARWRFLRDVATAEEAVIATAHTRDDNVETILMRVMRGSGARGLAALYAESDVARPLLDLARDTVRRYALAEGVRWVEDPSNESRAHLRNRLRHDILPALLAARPALGAELLDIARRAAALRTSVDALAATLVAEEKNGSFSVATAPLGDYDQEELRVLWPAMAARARIVLDARGTAGLARFTTDARVGDRMQLSGAIDVLRRRDSIVLRSKGDETPEPAPLGAILGWGRWKFVAVGGAESQGAPGDAWTARLPSDGLIVRAWRDGDRMHGAGDAAPRRVKRFLRDAGLAGPEREGWPVVVRGEEVVWIPGVRRSDAATVRSGRPEAVYVCERTER